ncbi:fibronectin type III domain-containing protein [Candidatus Omnitrophota bacterium]
MRCLYISITLCLILSGCAMGPTPIKKFVSPAAALYDQAGVHFEQQDYDAAIAKYEEFIAAHPRHNLIPGAHLGVAWSYYLKGNYEESLAAQKKVRTKDQTLKAWLDQLAGNCKTKLASAPAAASAPRLFDIPIFTNQKILKIEGTVPPESSISINAIEAAVQDGLFAQDISLEVGENLIKIEIIDKDGNIETKESKVTLDITVPELEVTDAELDDHGYVTISGLSEPHATVTANNEEFLVSSVGKFTGEVKLPHNLKIELSAEDRAGNIAKLTFADAEQPEEPTGLVIRSIYGTSVDLEWDQNPEQDIKGYNIYYSQVGGWSDQQYNPELIEETTQTMTGLESGNTYTIYLRAVDKMGNQGEPSEVTVNAVIP